MRILLFVLCLCFLGCTHAHEEEPLPVLGTLTGNIANLNEWLDDAEEIQVVLSWHVMKPNSMTDSYHMGDFTILDLEDSAHSFELEIHSPPPLRARIMAESLAIDEEDSEDWLALGFLSVYEPYEPGDTLNWNSYNASLVFSSAWDENSLLWGGSNTLLVAYWSGSDSIDAADLNLRGDTINPGLNLIKLDDDDDEVGNIIDFDTGIEVEGVVSWKPGYEICRWMGLGPRVDIWSDSEDYPSVHALPEEVTCGECGSIYDLETCTVDFGVLCSDCSVERTWAREGNPDADWPCVIEGRDCTEFLDEPRCVLNKRYKCISDRWELNADCSNGDDCCASGCVDVE